MSLGLFMNSNVPQRSAHSGSVHGRPAHWTSEGRVVHLTAKLGERRGWTEVRMSVARGEPPHYLRV